MFLVFDFECMDCGAIAEHVVKRGEANPHCPACGSSRTDRLIGAPKLGYTAMAANGTASSDAMTTAVDKWARARHQKWTIEQRNKERHGTED